jgi:hypothetical protein
MTYRRFLGCLLLLVCSAISVACPAADCETLKQQARAEQTAAAGDVGKIAKVLRDYDKKFRAAGCY